MPRVDVIRAWKNEDYRLSLSDEERAGLPENPAGIADLSDTDLKAVAGAFTIIICPVETVTFFAPCTLLNFCGTIRV